ncbi:DUF6288 domain-containing protein [Rubritalea tangerina]|uniref:DUF6288 domain-containing protein n=2 Tax=Rubritalea tangerina TaxID=430798 RepID=A0ABW4Z9K2_9BACT
MDPEKVYPRFPIGPTGLYATIEKGGAVTVEQVAASTPAAEAQLMKGDLILAINYKSLKVGDPRVALGTAIAEAEATNGKLVFTIERGGMQKHATVILQKLGGYAEGWPEKCSKSASIIKSTTRYIVESQQENGSYVFGNARPELAGLKGCLASLYLLSTGEPEVLPVVERHVQALIKKLKKQPTTSNWHLGYQGILLAEYYLKTGDRSVLPSLKSLCDQAVRSQVAGGWGHGGIPGPGYVQSGLMSSAGVPVLTTLILANECGVEIDQKAYAQAVKFMYRMVGHGCVPYGDHRSELWWSNTNGRNAMLACAFALFDDPIFQQASGLLATMVVDSYFQPEFGHTGGGFNVMWRGMASVHVPSDRRSSYSRQMRKLEWYYELSRQSGGGFSILPTPPNNVRYAGAAWGSGAIGLTYTAPLRQLRILGGPPTKHSVTRKPPVIQWGTQADRAFLSTEHAKGFGKEELEPHEIYDLTIGKQMGNAQIALYAKHLRHANPLVRSWCARVLKDKNSDETFEVIAKALAHGDPRVRRAGFDIISGYDNWRRPFKSAISRREVSRRFLPAILKTLNNPQSSWWEIDGALFALGRAEPEDIRRHVGLIDQFSKHEEWYLREGAFWALVGLRKSMTGEEFEKLTDMYARSRHVFERSSFDRGFWTILKSDRVVLGELSESAVGRKLGKTMHDIPVVPEYGRAALHEAAHRTMMVAKHFDSRIDEDMIPGIADYLKVWEPYHQHSVWLISGSRWQPGVLKFIGSMGEEAQPIVMELENILKRYDRFDSKRNGKVAGELKGQIQAAVIAWREKHS